MTDEQVERALLLADATAGVCAAARPGCLELGKWKPFYRGYVCRKCIEADQRCIHAGHLPPWWKNAKGDHAEH